MSTNNEYCTATVNAQGQVLDDWQPHAGILLIREVVIGIKRRQLLKLLEGITMQSSQDSKEQKQTPRNAKMKPSANAGKPKDKDGERSTPTDASTTPIGRVVTEEQYRARVSKKAYELFEKRQAATPAEDWLEAERLVKTELLAEGQWAGTV